MARLGEKGRGPKDPGVARQACSSINWKLGFPFTSRHKSLPQPLPPLPVRRTLPLPRRRVGPLAAASGLPRRRLEQLHQAFLAAATSSLLRARRSGLGARRSGLWLEDLVGSAEELRRRQRPPLWMCSSGLSMSFPYFCFFYTINRGRRATASENRSFTVTLPPRRLRKIPRLIIFARIN